MSQTPRAATARGADTRAAGQRRGSTADGRGRLHVDPRLLPQDVELKWVRETYLGQHDGDNVQANMEDAWEPATAAQYPSLVPPPLPGAPTDTHGLIRRGGMILMQRPKEYGDEDRAAFAKQNAEILASVDRDRRANTQLLDGENFQALRQDPNENAATVRKGRFADA